MAATDVPRQVDLSSVLDTFEIKEGSASERPGVGKSLAEVPQAALRSRVARAVLKRHDCHEDKVDRRCPRNQTAAAEAEQSSLEKGAQKMQVVPDFAKWKNAPQIYLVETVGDRLEDNDLPLVRKAGKFPIIILCATLGGGPSGMGISSSLSMLPFSRSFPGGGPSGIMISSSVSAAPSVSLTIQMMH